MKFFSTYSHIFHTVFFFLLIGCSKEEVPEPTKAQDISEADALSREAKSGIQMLADGSKFSGEMEQGVPHGYGRKEFENWVDYSNMQNREPENLDYSIETSSVGSLCVKQEEKL